jgi:hypothetical protein
MDDGARAAVNVNVTVFVSLWMARTSPLLLAPVFRKHPGG